ncbi:S9 family peptidase [Salarchaeum japonicum]|uniref:S9 family peptidase n=1 Tax=Salarchaeum japonicum TaxID=555573 RepID=A0AAV3T327_9EURY|nr:S9 family peptidase [Salarchaeum japonicum]
MTDDFSAERYYDYSVPSSPAVSPDGDRVAFLATEFDEAEDDSRTSLFVAPTDGSRDPYRLTRASDASNPQWGPDGDRLAFVGARDEDAELAVENERDDEDDSGPVGGDGPRPQVWVFDLARGGDARQVTDRDYGVSDFDWGPDGDRLVVAGRDPTEADEAYLEQREDDGPVEIERLQHKANGTGWLDEVATYLFVVDVADRTTVRLDDAFDAEKGSRWPLQPAWSPDGDRIAFVANQEDDPDDTHVTHLYTIRPDGTGLRRETDAHLRLNAPEWSPDGSRLAVAGGDPYNWYKPTEAYVLHPGDGELSSVSGSLDRTLGMDGAPRWLDDDTLVSLVGDEGNTRLVRLAADRDSPERVFDAQGTGRSLSFLDVSGGTLAFRLDDPATGADVHALPVDALDDDTDDALTRISRVNADIVDDAHTPECVRVEWENSDGVTIEGLAYLPPDFDPDDPDPHPVVSAVHGGPMAYDDPAFRFDTLFWTNEGYVVLRTNYRGSTSYGREFAERLRGTRGDLEVDDVVTGVEALTERGWVDADERYLTGFSYGGITTAAAVTKSHAFAAAAAEHGIYDFRSTFGTDDNHLWHEDEFGLPWENEDTYREISTIDDVGNVETPLLVTAGEEDWRCPPTQAEQLYVSVKKQGVDSKLVVYQNEHHNIGDPDRAIHRLETLADWFDTH